VGLGGVSDCAGKGSDDGSHSGSGLTAPNMTTNQHQYPNKNNQFKA